MVDRYTKVALTVIAVALSVIAWTNLKPSMPAYAQLTNCTRDIPCPVVLMGLAGGGALPVIVTNK